MKQLLIKKQEDGLAESSGTQSLCSVEWLRRTSRPIYCLREKRLKVIDLFCGCGGMSLGLIEAANLLGRGVTIALALDSNPIATKVYEENFSDYLEELRTVDIETELSQLSSAEHSKLGEIDVVLAGPPCQGHSDLNNHTRRNDPRNLLYYTCAQFISKIRPRIFIIENVRSAIHDKIGVIGQARSLLGDSYKIFDLTLSAQKIGIPQRRTRHFLIGVIKPTIAKPPSIPILPVVSVQEAIGDLEFYQSNELIDSVPMMSPENRSRVNFLYSTGAFDLPNDLRPACHRDKRHTYVSMYGRLRWDQPAQTITTGFGSMGQGRFLHPSRPRLITPHEASRLQGLPDFFSFASVTHRTQLQTLIGNAVPPKMLGMIVLQLAEGGVSL